MKHITQITACGAVAITLAACGAGEQARLPGERLNLDGSPVVERSNRVVAAALGTPRNVTSWTQRAGNAANNMAHAAFTTQPNLIWAADIGEGNERKFRITADPVAENGRIFTMDSRSLVSAVSTGGDVLWQTDLTPAGDRERDGSGGGLAVSGNRLFVTNGFGELVVLNSSDGSEIWKQDLQSVATGAPTLANGMVYVALRDGRAVTLDPDSGRMKWQIVTAPSATGVGRGASIGVDGSMAILPFSSAHLTGVFAKGGYRAWEASVAGKSIGQTYSVISDVSGDPVISGNTVIAASPAGRTVSFGKSDGRLNWVADKGAMGPVLVTGRSVYLVSDGSELVRLNRSSGDVIWSEPLPTFKPKRNERRLSDIYLHFGPVLAAGRLWVASGDGRLRSFDAASGAMLSDHDLGAAAAARPIFMDGTMYVVTANGQVRALR